MELRLDDYPNIRLLQRDGRPYARSSLTNNFKNTDGMQILGFETYKGARPKTSNVGSANLPSKIEKEAETAVKEIEGAETSFTENPIQSVNSTEYEVNRVLNTFHNVLSIYKITPEMKNYVTVRLKLVL